MSAFGNSLGSSYNEPPTDDQTSAPPVPQPTAGNQMGIQRKKKKLDRKSSTLAAAIARSKRAHQTGNKYGS